MARTRPDERSSRSRIWWIGGLLLLVAGTGIAVAWRMSDRQQSEPIEVPDVALNDVSRDIGQVIQQARRRVIESPDDAEAWGRLGMAFYAHNMIAKSLLCFQQAETLAADDYRWPYFHGMILAESDTAAGLPHVRRALTLAGTNLAVQLRLAEFLFDLRQIDESRNYFQAARQIDAQHPRALLGLARIAYHQRQWQAARELAEQARQAAPQRRDIHELLAQVYHQLGEQPQAEQAAGRAQELQGADSGWPDPLIAEAVLMRADTGWLNEQANQFLAAGQMDEHIRILGRLVQLEPDDAMWHIRLSRAFLRAGEIPAAMQTIQAGLRRHPDAVELGLLSAIMANEQQDYATAVTRLEHVLQIKPDYPEAYYVLAHAYRGLGRRSDALAALRNVLRFEPLYAQAHYDLGDLLLEDGQRRQAIVHLRQAVQQDPDNKQAQRRLRDAEGGQ